MKFKITIIVLILLTVIFGYTIFDHYNERRALLSSIEENDRVDSVVLDQYEGLGVNIPESNSHAIIGLDENEYYSGVFVEGEEFGNVTLLVEQRKNITESKSVIPFVVDYGTSKNFVFAGLFENNNKLTHVSSVLLGDRISIKEIQLENDNNISVSFLTFGINQSFVDNPEVQSYVKMNAETGEFISRITNANADEIYIENISIQESLPRNLVIEGQAHGSWYFEAVFPFTIYNDKYEKVFESYVEADDDWMVDGLVPFSRTIEIPDDLSGNYILILRNDNPSDLRELDKQIETEIRL